jgi:two-component system sensor histidine kinase/response regulator
MPRMDGFGLVEHIKENPELSTATIMMLTSGGQRGDAARCEELGIAAYLLKPVRQSELRQAIARVLSAKEQAGGIPMITRYSLHGEAAPAKRLHILLAEDNAVNQKLAIRLLEKRGHHVSVVGNGREALSALAKNAYDLVLMDVHMPDMDGLEATRRLRQKEEAEHAGSRQAVVAMTALVMKGDRERCVEAGMDGFLAKPIRPQELDAVLDLYLARNRDDASGPPASVPTEASVCTAELLERIDGDRTLLAELVALLRESYPGQVRAAREAVIQGDALGLQRVGHSLKGALGNLGAPIGSRIAFELESMGRGGDLGLAQARLDQLEDELIRVMESLEGLCLEAVQ